MEYTSGHRNRLLERYRRAGIAAFHDYEILELLLTLLIPRKDTKGIARELLLRYGSLRALLAAPERELVTVKGLGERSVLLLKFIRDMQNHCLQEQYTRQDYIQSQSDVLEYLKFHLSHLVEEYVAGFFLDVQNRVIVTEILAQGSVNHCVVYPRKIFDRALQCGAAGILIAHNHPGGSLKASEQDWILTKKMYETGNALDISLVDHILVTDSGLMSLREQEGWSEMLEL